MSAIKSICPAQEYYAAYCSDNENDIPARIEQIICWSVIKFDDPDEPDEVVGQIFNGECITEANNVDGEDGFGAFIGYFPTKSSAKQAIAENEDDDDDDDEEYDDDDI